MKTAVEQLIIDIDLIKFSNREEWVKRREEAINKAKELEKKQMSDSFGMGMEIFAGQPVEYELDFEYYFNKYYNN